MDETTCNLDLKYLTNEGNIPLKTRHPVNTRAGHKFTFFDNDKTICNLDLKYLTKEDYILYTHWGDCLEL